MASNAPACTNWWEGEAEGEGEGEGGGGEEAIAQTASASASKRWQRGVRGEEEEEGGR